MANLAKTVTGIVGPFNTSDYVAFDVVGTQTVTLDLSARYGTPELVLLNASGVTLGVANVSASGPTAANAGLVQVLAPGHYYAQVDNGAASAYTLTIQTGNVAVGTSGVDAGGAARATAAPLGFLSATPVTIADYIGGGDLVDDYSFALSGTSKVEFVLSGLKSSVHVALLDGAGSLLATYASAAGSLDRIDFKDVLPAIASGTYTLQITADDASKPTGYNLSLSATPIPDLAGNTLALARAVGTLAGTKTFGDAIGGPDSDDYYSFSVSALSRTSFLLSGVTAPASLEVLDASGTRISIYTATGATPQNDGSILVTLPPLATGTYYAHVTGLVPTNYTLSLSASAIPDGAGSTFATAAAITPTTRTESVTDFVGPGDTTDTYAITLATPGTLNLRLTGAGLLQGGATLSLVNAFNGSLAFSAATQFADGLVTQALGAGTYYAVISAAASTDNAYTLSYSLGAPVVGAGGLRDTAGNTPATARSIGTLGTSSTSYPEFIGASDTADYYTFTVVAPVIVSFDVTGLSNAAALELDGVDGPLNDGAYDNSAAGLTASLAAGTYWFSIQGNADTPYNLRVVSTLIPDGAGSSRATGRAVGVLGTTPQSFSDYVGNGDEYDDYTFSLTAESTVSFSVTGATSDVGAYLTTAAGTQLLFDDFGQVRDLSIARTLAAGSYDFLVRNGGSIFSSNYTLTMSAAPLGAPVAPTLQAAGTLGALGLPTRSDLNGDGKTDLVWRRTDGTIVDWTMNGSTITSGVAVGTLGTDWTLLANADLNGDGNADLVWRQDSTGTIVDWTMKGATTVSGAVVGTLGADWSLLGTGDLNGDGNSDLIWRNASGTIVDWQMNGAVVTSGTTIGTLGADWTLLGTGDFNRDGRSDLLWQQSGSGTIVEWDMSGAATIQAGTVGALDASWTFLATADFDGDGVSDLLWRNSAGAVVVWEMNAEKIVSSAVVGTLDTSWSFISAGDLNGDGHADIAWRSAGGTIVDWAMNGLVVTSGTVVGTLDSSWKPLI